MASPASRSSSKLTKTARPRAPAAGSPTARLQLAQEGGLARPPHADDRMYLPRYCRKPGIAPGERRGKHRRERSVEIPEQHRMERHRRTLTDKVSFCQGHLGPNLALLKGRYPRLPIFLACAREGPRRSDEAQTTGPERIARRSGLAASPSPGEGGCAMREAPENHPKSGEKAATPFEAARQSLKPKRGNKDKIITTVSEAPPQRILRTCRP